MLGEMCTVSRAAPAAVLALGTIGAGLSSVRFSPQLTAEGWGRVSPSRGKKPLISTLISTPTLEPKPQPQPNDEVDTQPQIQSSV